VIEPEVLKMIPSNRKVSLEREIFPLLVSGGKLSGFPFSGHWFDIGNLADYQKANFSLLEKQGQQSIPDTITGRLARDAVIRPPIVLGDESRVEGGASVGPLVVAGKNVHIDRNARVSGSILFDGVSLGENSVVSGAILAVGVKVAREARIADGSIVSPYVQIHDGVRIGRNSIIHPYKEIESSIRSGTNVM
jgi:mannose-1-phosphate guanylyltransferase/phosphomannomutase